LEAIFKKLIHFGRRFPGEVDVLRVFMGALAFNLAEFLTLPSVPGADETDIVEEAILNFPAATFARCILKRCALVSLTGETALLIDSLSSI
jgi:hypothetical protein